MNTLPCQIGESENHQADLAIYTVGYQGETIEHFLAKLLRAGIRRLVDVRRNPISRKPGFSKRQLKERAAAVGIGYEHLPELGVPSSQRRDLRDRQDYERLLRTYEGTILPAAEDSVDLAAEMISDAPSALVCFEADWRCCHRSRLAKAIAARTQLRVQHL